MTISNSDNFIHTIQTAPVEDPIVIDDGEFDAFNDNPNDLPLEEQTVLHQALLAKGWRPTRWSHPILGEHEMVITDGFWIWRFPRDGKLGGIGMAGLGALNAPVAGAAGIRWGMKHAGNARSAGRPLIARDEEGNLIAVAAPAGTPRFRGEESEDEDA